VFPIFKLFLDNKIIVWPTQWLKDYIVEIDGPREPRLMYTNLRLCLECTTQYWGAEKGDGYGQ
jgi:hypothetical protein